MSSDKQITECFKMKKPKSSPPTATSGELATPKRRIGKSKLTPNKLRRPTPNGSKEGSPQNHPDRAYSSPPVDLDNFIVDQFLCSQDVVHNDVVWDCTSPRNRMLSGNARGGSDVESLVKLFRTKPQEVKPAPSTFNIITASFTKTSALGRAATPRKKAGKGKKRAAASSATSAQAVVEQMQELWNIVQQSRQGGSQPLPPSPATEAAPPLPPPPQDPSEQPAETTTSDGLGEVALKVEAEVVPQRDVTTTTTTASVVPLVAAAAAAVGVLISDDDYDKWIMDDDSILAAATQDIDMPSPARKYSKTPTRQPAQAKPSDGGGGAMAANVNSPVALKTPPFVSPLRRPANSSTPKGASATRKSPRLTLLSLNRTPSPLRPHPVKPDKAADNAPDPPLEACSRKSSTEVLFEDDDEDDLLDQICSTYEQQQQMDAKVTATAVSASSAKFSTAATATSKPAEKTGPAVKPVGKPPSGTFAVPSANTSSSSLKIEVPKLTTAAGDPAGKKIGPQGVVGNGSANLSRPKASLPAKCAASLLRQVSTLTARPPGQLARPTTYGKPATFGVPVHSKPSTVAVNQPKVVLERCAALPPKASLGVKPSPSSRSSAPSKPHMPASSAPAGRPPGGTVQTGGKADTGLDFDDDDSDLATPEVMSWLEKVESQPTKNQRCTPEEIAKKREEALQRRRLKAKGPTEWTGRLRVSK